MTFKEKKFVYKLMWLFVKKIEHQTIIILVLQKRLQEQKRQQKQRSVLESPFFVRRKKNAMQPKLVGRREFILVNCFLVCMKDSRKYY